MATVAENGSPRDPSRSRLLPDDDSQGARRDDSGPSEDGNGRDSDGRLEHDSTTTLEHASPADAKQSMPLEPNRGSFLASLSSWTWELVSLVTGYALLAAIFVTLSQYDGKDLPEWPYSLNLNSLVAIYTTILRALLLFPVAEVISQARWPWFRRPRPLRHLDTFDHASRGAWGSAQLLFITHKFNVPFVAAITTIVSLAIGPFTQQAVKTTLCEHVLDDTSAQVPIASKIGSDEVRRGYGSDVNFQPESHHALLSGILGPPSQSLVSALDFTCPTGNCTFTAFNEITYSSLGICSRCENVTASIRESDCDIGDVRSCNFTITPPFSPPVSARPYLDALSIASSGTDDLERYNMINTSLLIRTKDGCTGSDVDRTCPSHDAAPGLTYTNMIGAKCSLYSCIKQYHGEIRGGELSETVVSTSALQPNGSEIQANPFMGVTMPCIIDGALYDTSNLSVAMDRYNATEVEFGGVARRVPSPCVFNLSGVWMRSLGKAVEETVAGRCGDFCPASKWWLSSIWQDDAATFASVARRFEDIAESLTDRLRSIGLAWDSLDPTEGPTRRALASGTVRSTTVCIRFDWEWVLLPTGVAVMASALLAVAIVATHRHRQREPAWKSSTLPLLFHGLRDVDGVVPPDHRMSLNEMEKRADAMLVRYDADGLGGCGFMAEPVGGGGSTELWQRK